MSPTTLDPIGQYTLQVELYDTMKALSTYKFIVEVLENNFVNGEMLKNGQTGKILTRVNQRRKVIVAMAKLAIQKVTREGKANIKFTAGGNPTGHLAI